MSIRYNRCEVLGLKLLTVEFVCVISVEGSLLSYEMTKDGEDRYVAKLKSLRYSSKQPEKLVLRKIGQRWQAPAGELKIALKLIECIEAKPVEESEIVIF